MMDLIRQINAMHDRWLNPPDEPDIEITQDDAMEYIACKDAEEIKKAAYGYFDKLGWEKLADWMRTDDVWTERIADWKN